MGRLHTGIFSHKLGRVGLSLLWSCGAYAPYSEYHSTGCLLAVICKFLVEACECIVIKPVLMLSSICTYVYLVFVILCIQPAPCVDAFVVL